MNSFWAICKQSYTGSREVFRDYWRAYHGWPALLASPYLHAAVVLTVLLWSRWTSAGWPDDVLTVVPSVLGFSLGGYAMLLAFGDVKFLQRLAEPEENGAVSYYLALNASFVHFIVVQMIAIVLALIGKAYMADPPSLWAIPAFLCYLVFVYSIMAALAATFAIFRMASLYGKVAGALRDTKE
jgi:hypothetical protein